MIGRNPHHPDATQELLLRSAFGDLDEAAVAWAGWKRLQVQPDAGSRRLLPQVYRHLHANVDDPAMHQLAETYRLTWVRNQIRARDLAAVLRGLANAGIPALVLKGGALAQVAYGDWGARPMADFDVLVRRTSAVDALAFLSAQGFHASSPLPPAFLDHHHGTELVNQAGHRLDLHWRLVHECCGPGAEETFWERRQPLPLDGIVTGTLCLTDHLFHVLLHGARSSAVQPVGWAADAAALLTRRADEIDWDRLLTHVTQHSVVVPVRSALGWLRSRYPALVPESAVTAARSVPAPLWQHVEHEVKVRPRRLVGTAPVLIFDHRRLRQAQADAPGLARYLQSTFRLTTVSELPGAMLHLAGVRIGARLRPDRTDGGAAENAKATLLAGTLRVLAGELLILTSGIVAAGILSRSLGVVEYGVFSIAATFVYWVEMSVPMLYARAVLGANAERDVSVDAGVQWLYLATGLVFAATILLAAPIAGYWLGDAAIATYLSLFALDVPLAAIAAGQRVLLFAREAYSRVAVVSAMRAVGRLVFIALALAVRPDVTTAILASIAATAIELSGGFVMLGGGWLSRPRWPRLDVGGAVVPLALSSLSLRLFRRLDLLLLQALARSGAATGLYGAAQNVTLVLTSVNNALPPALLSSLARLGPDAHEARRHVTTAAFRLLLLPLPALAFCAVCAPTIAALVYGEAFRPAGSVMAILALASYAEVLGAIVAAPLIASGRVSRVLAATAPLVPLAALGHMWAIPRLGPNGAAAVTLLLSVGAAAVVGASAFRLRLVGLPARSVVISLAVSGISALAAAFVAPIGWTVVPLAITAGVLGAGLLVATGAVPAADVKHLLGRAANKRR